MQPKVETDQLSKTFVRRGGALAVLADINLTVSSGEFVSLIGASGCGKTTLLRMLHGLLPPTAGQVMVDGRPVHRPDRSRGYVLQHDSLLSWRTVLANVTFGLEVHRIGRRQARARAGELLELVGLAGFESHYPGEISGGMRQRVNLARALAIDPDILLMDEPFAALDAQTREVMQLELLRIWEVHRKTVIFVTHQLEEAVFLSDRIIVLGARPGRVRETILVDIPRPRDLHTKRTPEFAGYVDRIWQLIEREVMDDAQPAARP